MLSPSHSNISDVTRPQTNSGSVCVSLCAGQVLFDTIYLLVEGTCASTKRRQDRKFQAQRDVQCLCQMHRCVELWSIECERDEVHDTDSDYNAQTQGRRERKGKEEDEKERGRERGKGKLEVKLRQKRKNRKRPSRESNPGPQQTRLMLYH